MLKEARRRGRRRHNTTGAPKPWVKILTAEHATARSQVQLLEERREREIGIAEDFKNKKGREKNNLLLLFVAVLSCVLCLRWHGVVWHAIVASACATLLD
jgi:hypothetical protein